ncbi:ester cyclase [Microbacterium sp. RD1]|uniref:ester cyclase n=1 Tax=Microbacterium sp. RD1 TaxID=3457313 RepID=UPI003FA541E7
MDETGRTLAEKYVTMLNTHDANLVDELLAEDYVNHNAFVADGREANREFWGSFFAAISGLTTTMEDLIVAGDRVVGRFVTRGTHTGELMGFPATNNPVEMRTIDIWRVENGVFVEHWDEINSLEVFQQIGAVPAVGPEETSNR